MTYWYNNLRTRLVITANAFGLLFFFFYLVETAMAALRGTVERNVNDSIKYNEQKNSGVDLRAASR